MKIGFAIRIFTTADVPIFYDLPTHGVGLLTQLSGQQYAKSLPGIRF